MYEVTETFKDIDNITVHSGTKVDDCVPKGQHSKSGRVYWNLINGNNTVVAVTLGRPPVRKLPDV